MQKEKRDHTSGASGTLYDNWGLYNTVPEGSWAAGDNTAPAHIVHPSPTTLSLPSTPNKE